MSEELNTRKSPLEQILEATFAFLEKQDQFDSETVQKLRRLASQSNLTKQRIIKAIQEGSEKGNETA